MVFGRSLARIIITHIVLSLLFIAKTDAIQTEFSSSLNPVGSGARAAGMGGAFIGVADDATAASWNPAGLIQLEKPEVSAVYSYFHRKQAYGSEEHPEVNSEQNMNADGLNYASLAFPFAILKRNMIVSVNYQRLYEMNKEYTFDFITKSTDDTLKVLSESGEEDFRQEGFLYSLSPAVAVEVTPEFSIGATYNLWDNFFGRNGWEINKTHVQNKTFLLELPLPPPFNQTYEINTETRLTSNEDYSFKGRNLHFGFLWKLFDSITIGGVYKTPFDADVEQKRTITTYTLVRQKPSSTQSEPTIITLPEETEKFVLRMPASYGIGLSYRPSDNLTFACDAYRTEWSRFVVRDQEGNESNPLTTSAGSDGRLKDTTQVRLGMEYLFIKEKGIIPLRFGLFYDPEPATGHLDEYYGASFGTGFAGGRITLDISYQYRIGNNVSTDFLSASDSDPDVDQHTVMVSAIFYLK